MALDKITAMLVENIPTPDLKERTEQNLLKISRNGDLLRIIALAVDSEDFEPKDQGICVSEILDKMGKELSDVYFHLDNLTFEMIARLEGADA